MFFFIFLFFIHTGFTRDKCGARYDSFNITHQEVKNLEEFFFCFGYHHGKDRAWQMDFFRRAAQGRNAEIYGFSHLKQDLMMHLLDLEGLSKKIWQDFPEDKKRMFQLYANGVNEGFKIGGDSREFKDKGYRPEKWMASDSLTLLLLQSFDQTRKTFIRDHEEEKAKDDWGNKAALLFDEDNVPWENTILKDGEYPKKGQQSFTTSVNQKKIKWWSEFPSVFGDESGSNSWVINSKKSNSGYAILANDPHLDLRTPLFWYWIHLKSPEMEVIGASLPGVPVIPSGTNGKVSWGLTNAYINTADLIFLKDEKDGDVGSIRPIVKVKWGPFKIPFFLKTFDKTRTGLPIVPLEVESREKLVLRWSGFGLKAKDIWPMMDLFTAKDADEMNEILKGINLPSWNYVFADTKGKIGFRVVGKVYKHPEKLPFGIPRKNLDEISQEEFLNADEKPHLMNPSRNYIYTANNRHWPSDALFYGGRGYNFSFRGFRIDELLQGKQDIQSFKNIQCDHQAVDARFFIPKILPHIKDSDLEGWNYISRDDSVASALYRRFMDLVMEKWKVNEYALYRLLDNLTAEQLKEFQELYKLAKKEINNRPWAKVHRLGFAHLSKNEEWIFSPEIAGTGDNHSVDPGTSKWNKDLGVYEQTSGASMRMIIEMQKRPVIYLALPGQNREYSYKQKATPWEAWKSCKYQSIEF